MSPLFVFCVIECEGRTPIHLQDPHAVFVDDTLIEPPSTLRLIKDAQNLSQNIWHLNNLFTFLKF